MKNHFCTLFDSFYLTRGLALYRSLAAAGEGFTLYVYCFDDRAYEILSQLALPDLVPVRLSDFETPELLKVKPTRSRAEYCWTCTPHVLWDAMRRFKLEEITYLDADLFFFEKPSILLEEFRSAGASVLLTEHRYSPKYDQSAASGTYCVQFMAFRSDARGKAALKWWGERCLEWCYARLEDGKFGDQKYLEDWTRRFAGVHVLQHAGGGVAPWNIQRYALSHEHGKPHVDGKPVVFYHFHALKWLSSHVFCSTEYEISVEAKNLLYRPYVRCLIDVLEQVRGADPGFDGGILPTPAGLRSVLSRFKRKIRGTYHVFYP